ncbi:hypothetical protein ACOSOMT5_P1784 [Acidiphilium sp. MT5]
MRRFRLPLLLLFASLALSAIAVLRGGEYDEFYTLFLLAGDPRPAWPARPFHPAEIRADFTGTASFARIATALRRDDVHPPLYFWLAKFWRAAFGPSLRALRLLSVLCAIIALALLARIAAALGIDPPTALILTLGCYGFAYSSIVARDFSLATLFILAGLLALLRSKPTPRSDFLAGALLGAACCTNDLALFTALAIWLWLAAHARGRLAPITGGAALFVPLWAWFFLAQRNSRQGQFHHFHASRALAALARDQAAAVLGGLPEYIAPPWSGPLAVALAVFLLLLLLLTLRTRLDQPVKSLLYVGVLAPPLGLLILGLVFDTMPFEIRYVWLGLPFIGLLLAASLAPHPRLRAALIALNLAALLGLAIAPQTMQPGMRLAQQSAHVAGAQGLIIIPFGNDGVGIPGPFISALPARASILVARRATPHLLSIAAPYPLVVLPDLTVDHASRIFTPALIALFQAAPGWRQQPGPHNLLIFTHHCQAPHG